MQKLLLPVLLFLAACGSKQSNNTAEKNENSDYIVSLDGIGPVKNGMSQAELEKILNQKIPLTNPTDTVSGSWMDSAVIKWKDAEMHLSFVRTYAYKDLDSFHMRVNDIKTSSPLCKTAEGAGIGFTKQQVISTYSDYKIYMGPEFIMINDTTWERSKSLYLIRVREAREGPQIVFYLKDNKVHSIEVSTYYDDEE